MLVTDAVQDPTFANHETFHLRYGWLKKAYDRITDDPGVFAREDAPVRLGVGKNMVRAIRFWGIAGKVMESRGKGKNATMAPTDMGRMVFDSKRGLDPYLERPETLWLLHWLLFAPPCRMPVWWMIMNDFAATNVKLDEVTDDIMARVTNIPEWNTPSPKSVKKDIDVFIHTYSTRQAKMSTEDYLDCPFRQLRMIRQRSGDTMRFVFGVKYGMSPLVTAFACLDFVARSGISAKSVSVSRLAAESGGVGNAFKVNENELLGLLDEACTRCGSIKLQNINGSAHLVFGSAREASLEALSIQYGKRLKAAPVMQRRLR